MLFTKVQGLGNDFIIVNAMQETKLPDYSTLAIKICDRHFGVGGDGLILVLPSDTDDIRMRIINSDGSEPEMCGNGIRCFAKFIYEEGIVPKEEMRVETLAGTIIPHLVIEDGKVIKVRVDMGEPRLEREQIPMQGAPGKVVNEEIHIDGEKLAVTCVSMGNPHCITFVPDVEKIPLTTMGPKVETHQLFPKKTNVEFIQILNENEVNMRVWERGAGETLACGTGACATAVACVLNGKTQRKVKVHLAGGDLEIEWSDNNHIYMTGPAANVFTGIYKLY